METWYFRGNEPVLMCSTSGEVFFNTQVHTSYVEPADKRPAECPWCKSWNSCNKYGTCEKCGGPYGH